MRLTARRRAVLGGAMDGQTVTVLHGSVMTHAPSGDQYRRHGEHWWVPVLDTDDEASERVRKAKAEYLADCNSD